MILFRDRARDIQVIRTKDSGLGVDYIGVLRQPDTGEKRPHWVWDTEATDIDACKFLSKEEKLSIISMMDRLDGFGYRHCGMRLSRWCEITGLPEELL